MKAKVGYAQWIILGLLSICLLSLFQKSTVFAAEESLSVTVTPPLIQLTIGPGESWNSVLKIVNNNTYDVTYYASPTDFEADGEQGKGKFIPLVTDTASGTSGGQTLGYWVEISPDPIVIKRGMSAQVPFTVRIPENASPGGHYAAILVGTMPDKEEITGPSMKISSFVTSLLFVRIKGDVIEKGRIREFVSTQSLYETPQANFLLRFENLGNTHLKPQGDITLYNMWGKERGKVTFNRANNFGNVLPNSVRKFEFSWKGEESVFDIGRYSAVVTLGYGEEGSQNSTATAYFWVVPLIPVFFTLGSIVLFAILITWLIRRYIRRALALEKERHFPEGLVAHNQAAYVPTIKVLIEPLKEGVVDLRTLRSARVREPAGETHVQRPLNSTTSIDERYTNMRPLTLFVLLQKYSLFLFFLALCITGAIALRIYFDTVLVPERAFEIVDITSQEEIPVQDEDIPAN